MPQDITTDLAALGPFFRVHAHLPGERPELPWRTVGELGTQPEPMRHRIAAVSRALAAEAGSQADQIEAKVAASIAHLGVVARLVSPALAAIALGYPLMTAPPELWWQDTLGGPFPLSVPVPEHCPGDHRQSARTACGNLLSRVIEPVTATVAALVPLSSRVLWGNVASAVNTASLQIAAQRPTAADAARQAAETIFSAPQLRTERNQPGPGFRRSSCCLYYRLAAGQGTNLCGDCVLTGHRQATAPG